MTLTQSASEVYEAAKDRLNSFTNEHAEIISQYLSLQEDVEIAEGQLKEAVRERRENVYTADGVFQYIPVKRTYIDYAKAMNLATPEEKAKINAITTMTATVDAKKFDKMVSNLEISRDLWVKVLVEEPMSGRVKFVQTK